MSTRKDSRGELITTGPYAPVKRRQYTAVALPVLPWLGFRLNSWLGAAIGAALAACGTGPGAQSPGTHPDRRCDATGRRSGCSRDQRP